MWYIILLSIKLHRVKQLDPKPKSDFLCFALWSKPKVSVVAKRVWPERVRCGVGPAEQGGAVGQEPRREDASAAAAVNEVVGGWSREGPRSPRGAAGHCVWTRWGGVLQRGTLTSTRCGDF